MNRGYRYDGALERWRYPACDEEDTDIISKDIWLEIELSKRQSKSHVQEVLEREIGRNPGSRDSERPVFDVLEDYKDTFEYDGGYSISRGGNRYIGGMFCNYDECEGYCVWCDTIDTPISDVFMWDAPGWLKSHYGTSKKTGELGPMYREEDEGGYRGTGKRSMDRRFGEKIEKEASIFELRKRLKGELKPHQGMARRFNKRVECTGRIRHSLYRQQFGESGMNILKVQKLC